MNFHQTSLPDTAAAHFLGLSIQTLRNWRHLGRGPAYCKLGRSVRYKIEDLLAFQEARRIEPRAGV